MRLVTAIACDLSGGSSREPELKALLMNNARIAWISSVDYSEADGIEERYHPLVVLVDLCEKPEPGLAVINRLKNAGNPAYLLVSGQHIAPDVAYRALELGATSVLPGVDLKAELEAAIEDVVQKRAGERKLQSELAASSDRLKRRAINWELFTVLVVLTIISAWLIMWFSKANTLLLDNSGSYQINDIEVVCSGGTTTLNYLPAHASASLGLNVSGESSLILKFKNHLGKTRSQDLDIYTEGSEFVHVEIDDQSRIHLLEPHSKVF